MTLSIDSIDERRLSVSRQTPTKVKSEYGQFMTPSVIGRFMSSLFRTTRGTRVRLLDPGCGIGSLTTEFVRRCLGDGVTSIESEVWELDPKLIPELHLTLRGCEELCESLEVDFSCSVRNEDFILGQLDLFTTPGTTRFTHCILNPPYKKIGSDSLYRSTLSSLGIETTNLYSGFVSVGIELLESGGEMVFITPRSFCNGPYFKTFRRLILRETSIIRVHLFESRTDSFKGDEVLQENVIFHLVKGEKQGDVTLSTSSDSSFSDLRERVVPFREVCGDSDPDSVFHLVVDDDDETRRLMGVYSHSLKDLGLSVSTGPVVDFRLKDSLRMTDGVGYVPLIHSFHFSKGFVRHPILDPRKPQYIEVNKETERWLTPRGTYVLVRRLSSKEEKRRVIPGLLLESEIRNGSMGIENHLNYYHHNKGGLTDGIGTGLTLYLGSTFVDRWIRRFSGHTQVNSTDLRSIGYPSLETLEDWGRRNPHGSMTQEEIDLLVGGGGR